MCTSLKKDSKAFAQRCKIMQYVVKDIKTNSFIKKLTSDSKTEDGANPHMAVIDEYHAHVDDSMLKVIETGVASREQPLILIITTAGFNKYSACYSFRKIVVDTLEGKLENESLFGIIWTLDEKDDWNDPKTWSKVNPNYGNTPKHEVFEGLYLRAVQEGGTSIVEFKTKNLNIWVDSAKVWINDKDWMLCETRS
jgi:phage terminase large subunit-like protein